MTTHAEPLKTHNNHNVYILGAGFSVGAGLPLMRNFLDEMRDAVDWLRQEKRDDEVNAIAKVLEFRKNAAAAGDRINLNVENIEELFSLAAANPAPDMTDNVITAIAATLDCCRKNGQDSIQKVTVNYARNSRLPVNWTPSPPPPLGIRTIETSRPIPIYEWYAGILSGGILSSEGEPRNTVITFNYDTVLEDALHESSFPFDYGLRKVNFINAKCDPKSCFRVLKLHGSVNWAVPEEKSPLGIYDSYDVLREHRRRPLLMPPTWRKNFGGPLNDVWALAVSAISEATRLVIVGFSMPRSDAHFKYLLAAGLQDNAWLRKVIVVDPSIEKSDLIRKRVAHLFRKHLFARGIIELRKKGGVRELLYDVCGLDCIRRTIDNSGLEFIRPNPIPRP